jgi:hypothetical protein
MAAHGIQPEHGGGAHHIVLLWPFPQMLVAASVVGTAERFKRPGMLAAAALIAWVAVFNVLVLNQHLVGWVRGGTSTLWTDAIFPLSRQLDAEPGRNVYVLDWGMLDALRLLNQGRLKLYVGSDALMDDDISAEDRGFLRHVFADPDATFIGHTPDKTVFTGVPARFDAALREQGYRKDALRVIRDRAGRPVFEVFRVVAAAPAT